MSKWENLKPGTTLIVRGNYMYDKYEHDFVILPYDVLQVERQQRQDTAPDGEKRVELHLHTKSSSMDGFNDPGKIVRLAHRMGHRAIAITDHGVCQGYPEAMLATDAIHEMDPNFKLIYGCEAYFVDDMIPAVYGGAQMPLPGSFVVFDTETTGLDSNTERLTEIGAVFVENGKINEEKKFCTFVNPGKPIPQKVVDLTGINDAMVADAPTPEEAIRAFKEFCGDNILVAHNAHSFDMLFIRKAGEKAGVSWDENTYIDTLPMGQALFPGLRNYKLDTINKHLEIPPFNHHRAVDDAMALARIFEVMLTDLQEKDIHTVEAINTGLGGNKEVLKKKYYHLIILVQNQVGLKNLYRIVSAAHTQYFFKKPRVPRSLLNQYREGLLLSPACEAGELYRAIVAGQPYEQLLRIGEGDLIIGISYPRYSKRTISAMKFARDHGARCLGMTDSKVSPLNEISDVCLYAKSEMVSFLDSLVAPMSLINALIMAVSARDRERTFETFRELETVWKEYEVYGTVES